MEGKKPGAADGRPLLSVEHLKTYFDVTKGIFSKRQIVKAVDDVSFSVGEGETFGLVGESGCGKSTLGRTLVKIYPATSGRILYKGKDIANLHGEEEKAFRKEVQMIFQDPYASLNPRMTIGDIIAEPIRINRLLPENQIEDRVTYLLNCVGLANHQRNRYPHEFSGGQRQRVGIARALAVQPKLIVCDEPVSALDVSIQAQVLNLLDDLKEEFGLTYLFIAHGLNVVKHISDRVGVMYLGKLMEVASKKEIYDNPLNPYTQALLSAIPSTDVLHKKERIILSGDVPTPINPPKGCRFCSRCFKKMGTVCDEQIPELHDVGGGHMVACHLYDEKM